MATTPHIPAPDRDLANEEPRVPPAADDTSPVTRAIMGSLAVGMGAAILVTAVLAALFQISPLPADVFDAENMIVFTLACLCGACFIGCGLFIFRRSLVMTSLLLVAALACGALITMTT